jgi:hypothetical protein
MNQPDAVNDVATMCAEHLRAEESLLEKALDLVRGARARFAQTGKTTPESREPYQQLAGMVNDMKVRRRRFRNELGRRLHCEAESVTVTRILDSLPARQRDSIAPRAERVRTMIGELLTINYWLAVHLRIHLDAYQRLLCDLTGTANSSGRYGPEGKTENGDFRPVLQIQG